MQLEDSEYLYFVDRAVRGMAGIVADLGDELAGVAPDLPGANTPYGLLTHVLGVIEYWAGKLVAGREVERDRASEFTAAGTVADLLARVDAVLEQLARDVASADASAPPRQRADSWAVGPDREVTQAGILLHVYEEAAQHHGQLEVLRDALRAAHPAPFDPPMPWLRSKRTVKWVRPGPDMVPAWVADMDFPVAPPIRAAITGMLDRGDLGYPEWSRDPLAEAFAYRMEHSFGWAAEPAYVRPVSDLIQALQVLLHLASEPGDRVLAHLPNYPPFPAAIATMKRNSCPFPLCRKGIRGPGTTPRCGATLPAPASCCSSIRRIPPDARLRPTNSSASPRSPRRTTCSSSRTRSTPNSCTHHIGTPRSRPSCRTVP